MKKAIGSVILVLALASAVYAMEDVTGTLHGSVTKVDAVTKTMVIKTADGSERSLRFLGSTAVHGARTSAAAGKDTWHGLGKGSEVVAHYARRSGDDKALEIDKVGRDGLKSTSGTIKDFDRDGRKMSVRTGDDTESAFRLTDHAAKEAGKDVAEGGERGARDTVHYSEDAGGKVAHFFEK